MIRMGLGEIAAVTGGALYGDGEIMIAGLFTDTRQPVPGALFVALRGPRFDAHDFIRDAWQGGAVAALVERKLDIDIAQIVVRDTRVALGIVASAWRGRWLGRMVALTGSNGKTTTKAMLASILSQQGKTLATRGNLNNGIGVPLMLAELDPSHTYAVIEMGANHRGEIAYLSSLARPDVALVTNTGSAHLQGFGGAQGVMLGKAEIYGGLGQGGVAVINADDPAAPLWRVINAGRASLSFGMLQDADVRGQWRPTEEGASLALVTAQGRVEIQLKLAGEHNGRNALAAAAAALALGVGLEQIKAGLEVFSGVPGRLQRKPGQRGSVLWDDSYNANPDSLRAGLLAVRSMGGETWLVLGDMAELGPESAELHAASGRMARALGVTRLFAQGDLALQAASAFGEGAYHFPDIENLIASVRAELRPGLHILIKGSRSSGMERVVMALEESPC